MCVCVFVDIYFCALSPPSYQQTSPPPTRTRRMRIIAHASDMNTFGVCVVFLFPMRESFFFGVFHFICRQFVKSYLSVCLSVCMLVKFDSRCFSLHMFTFIKTKRSACKQKKSKLVFLLRMTVEVKKQTCVLWTST